jgi:hypothetical protein
LEYCSNSTSYARQCISPRAHPDILPAFSQPNVVALHMKDQRLCAADGYFILNLLRRDGL